MSKDENTKGKILSVATKLFAEKGFDGVGIRELCQEAGVNISMISYYFGGKKELYQAIIDNLMETQLAYFSDIIDTESTLSNACREDSIDLLHQLIDRFTKFIFSDLSRELLVFMVSEQQRQKAVVHPKSFYFVRKVLAHILQKDESDPYVVLHTVFLIGNVISPRVLLHFSLEVMNKADFSPEDIAIIQQNAHAYLDMIIKENECV